MLFRSEVRPIFGAAPRRRKRRERIEEAVQEALEALPDTSALDAYADAQTRHLRALVRRYARTPEPEIDYRAIAEKAVAQWLAEMRAIDAARADLRNRDDEDAMHLILLAL